jgi:surface antigen
MTLATPLRRTTAIGLMLASLGMVACQSTEEGVGTAVGAVAGGLAGSQIGSGTGQLIATGIGVGVGALIGQQVGAYLNQRDRRMAEQTTVQTYRTGATSSWNNPDSGAQGTVVPVQTVQSGGADCQIQEHRVQLADGTTDVTRYRLCERNGQYYTEEI